MRRKLLRAVPWLLAVLVLGFAGVIVGKSVLWKPRETGPAPRWEIPQDYPERDVYEALDLEKAGKLKEAVDAFGDVLKREPTSWIALHHRADCLSELQRYDEAIVDLRKLLEADATRAELWTQLAWVQMRAKKRADAEVSAKKAIEVKSELGDAYLVLSDLAEQDPKESLARLEDYIVRASEGKFVDEALRKQVEDVKIGTYLQRVRTMLGATFPPGPDREARLELDARLYLAAKYMDLPNDNFAKAKAVEHLLQYLLVAKTSGDPNQDRFARAREDVARLQAQIKADELTAGEYSNRKPDGGAADPDGGAAAPGPNPK